MFARQTGPAVRPAPGPDRLSDAHDELRALRQLAQSLQDRVRSLEAEVLILRDDHARAHALLRHLDGDLPCNF